MQMTSWIRISPKSCAISMVMRSISPARRFRGCAIARNPSPRGTGSTLAFMRFAAKRFWIFRRFLRVNLSDLNSLSSFDGWRMATESASWRLNTTRSASMFPRILIASRSSWRAAVRRNWAETLCLLQVEINLDLHPDGYGNPVQVSRLILPLRNSHYRGGHQQARTRNGARLDHVSLIVDNCVNFDNSLRACESGDWRINGF